MRAIQWLLALATLVAVVPLTVAQRAAPASGPPPASPYIFPRLVVEKEELRVSVGGCKRYLRKTSCFVDITNLANSPVTIQMISGGFLATAIVDADGKSHSVTGLWSKGGTEQPSEVPLNSRFRLAGYDVREYNVNTEAIADNITALRSLRVVFRKGDGHGPERDIVFAVEDVPVVDYMQPYPTPQDNPLKTTFARHVGLYVYVLSMVGLLALNFGNVRFRNGVLVFALVGTALECLAVWGSAIQLDRDPTRWQAGHDLALLPYKLSPSEIGPATVPPASLEWWLVLVATTLPYLALPQGVFMHLFIVVKKRTIRILAWECELRHLLFRVARVYGWGLVTIGGLAVAMSLASPYHSRHPLVMIAAYAVLCWWTRKTLKYDVFIGLEHVAPTLMGEMEDAKDRLDDAREKLSTARKFVVRIRNLLRRLRR
jgi:hypothetical protein